MLAILSIQGKGWNSLPLSLREDPWLNVDLEVRIVQHGVLLAGSELANAAIECCSANLLRLHHPLIACLSSFALLGAA
jgi:hypothetical protein